MDVFPIALSRDYTWTDEPFLVDLLPSRPGFAERVALHPLPRRVYSLSRVWTDDERVALEAFAPPVPFLLEDPRDATQYDVALVPSTGDGTRTVFSLPTTGAASRYYARLGTGVATANGAIVSATFDVDARTITFGVAPTNGHAVNASFVPLRRVRLAAPVDWSSMTSRHGRADVEIEEIFRGS